MRVTRQLRILGLVQGVGYRDALRREARARSCTGWVRNKRDGSVEALVQGSSIEVEAVIAWARRGPPAARVTEVLVEDRKEDLDRPLTGFDWLPTA
jgi:acylphosphatase